MRVSLWMGARLCQFPRLHWKGVACWGRPFESCELFPGESVTPSIRKLLQRTFMAAAAPLALALHAPVAQADNAQDPVGFGGSPTFTNTYAGWSYSLFNPGSSIYPFTPFTNPACVSGAGATGCDNLTFVFDNTKVVWAANASVDIGAAVNPVTTIDTATPFPNVNELYKPSYVPDGPSNDGWVFGYVFGPTDTITGSYGGGQVNYLGFYNFDGGDIRTSHEVALWEFYTGTDPVANPPVKLASVVIGPGPVASACDVYTDLFCWVQLSTPVSLADNQFYTIGAYGGFNAPTPAPIPLVGAAAAFGLSRKLRQRIRFAVHSA